MGFTARLVIEQREKKGRNRKWKGCTERSSALRRKYTTLTHAKQRPGPNMAPSSVWPTQCLDLSATEIMYNAEGQLNLTSQSLYPSLLCSPHCYQHLYQELGTPSATCLHVHERRPKFHSFTTNFGHDWQPTSGDVCMINRRIFSWLDVETRLVTHDVAHSRYGWATAKPEHGKVEAKFHTFHPSPHLNLGGIYFIYYVNRTKVHEK